MGRPVRYMAVSDIARALGVDPKTVHTWRARYGPDRPAAQLRAAPPFPRPDVYVGLEEASFGARSSTAGWAQARLAEIRAWRLSLPGQGTGPRPSRRRAS
jgi:transposase-like protein